MGMNTERFGTNLLQKLIRSDQNEELEMVLVKYNPKTREATFKIPEKSKLEIIGYNPKTGVALWG